MNARRTVPAARLQPLLAYFVFLSVSSGTMVNVALPYVGAAFSASAEHYGWVVGGYTLTFGVLGAVMGRLADRYGLRRVFLVSVVVFGSTGVLNALAPSLWALVGFRVLQAVGAAAMPTLAATMLVRLSPEETQGATMGVLAGVIGLAASLGPVLGGALVEAGSWRWIFLTPALALLVSGVVLLSALACGLAAMANAGRIGTLVLTPIFLVELRGLSALSVGLVLLPGALAMGASAPLAGRFADAGHTRRSPRQA